MNEATVQELFSLFPALQLLPEIARKQLLNESRYLDVPQGQILFDSASSCEAFPLLLRGSIRVVSLSEQGRELLLYRVQPGELCLISGGCLLGQSPYPVTGMSESSLSLVMLPPSLFNSLINHESFRTFIFGLFSERMSELMQLVEAVAFLKLDRRLAALLLSKGQEIHTTHQRLADELGSVRELVSRVLRRFEEQGVISLKRESIEVLNRDALWLIAKP